MNVIALDIETKNLDMESDGVAFGNPEGWLVSCVSVWDASLNNHQDYNYANLPEIPDSIRQEYRVESFETLNDDLNEWYDKGYLCSPKTDSNLICQSLANQLRKVVAESEK